MAIEKYSKITKAIFETYSLDPWREIPTYFKLDQQSDMYISITRKIGKCFKNVKVIF